MCFGLVTAKSAAGSYDTNPFDYEHVDARQVQVLVDDRPFGESKMQMNFKETWMSSNYLQAYTSLFKGWSSEASDDRPYSCCDVTRKEFYSGYCMYVFRFTAYSERSEYLPTVNRGNVRLMIDFAKPLPETMCLVVYAKFASMLKVDQSRRVVY